MQLLWTKKTFFFFLNRGKKPATPLAPENLRGGGGQSNGHQARKPRVI